MRQAAVLAADSRRTEMCWAPDTQVMLSVRTDLRWTGRVCAYDPTLGSRGAVWIAGAASPVSVVSVARGTAVTRSRSVHLMSSKTSHAPVDQRSGRRWRCLRRCQPLERVGTGTRSLGDTELAGLPEPNGLVSQVHVWPGGHEPARWIRTGAGTCASTRARWRIVSVL
jgi:hypothetical protein